MAAEESTVIHNFRCGLPGDFCRSSQCVMIKLVLVHGNERLVIAIHWMSNLLLRWPLAFGNTFFFLRQELSCCYSQPPLWDFRVEWHCLPWLVQGSPQASCVQLHVSHTAGTLAEVGISFSLPMLTIPGISATVTPISSAWQTLSYQQLKTCLQTQYNQSSVL